MKVSFLVPAALALAALLFPAAHAAAPPPVRRHLLMDAGWRFQRAATTGLFRSVPISSWRGRPSTASDGAALAAPALDTSGPDWKASTTGQETFGGRIGFAVYRAALPPLTGPNRTLRFEGVDDNGTVYLNGKLLARHQGWNDPFDVPLDSAWNSAGPNIAAVLVENTGGGGGITGAVQLGLALRPKRRNRPPRHSTTGPGAQCICRMITSSRVRLRRKGTPATAR